MLASRMLLRGPAVRRTPASARALHNISSHFTPARPLRPTTLRPTTLRASTTLLSLRFSSTGTPVAPPPTGSSSTTPFLPDAAADSSTELLNGITSSVPPGTIGYLKSLGMDFGWGPSTMIQWLIEHVHVYTNTPWWASILISVLVIRGTMFPFYCKMSDNSAMMKEVTPLITPVTKRMRACQLENDQLGMMAAKAEMKDILARSGVNRMWLFFPFSQIPIFYGFYNNLRNMADLPVPEFVNGGIAWFTDLSMSDPYLALPLATAGMVSAQFALGGEGGANTMAKSMKTVLMIVVPGISFAFTHSWPAAIVFYIACSTSWGLIQAIVLKWTWFREKFNLYPLTPAQSVNPLAHLNIAHAPKKGEIVNPNSSKQWGAEGGFLDKLTGGQDAEGSWNIKKLQADAAERAKLSKHKAYERKRASAIALEKKKAALERERKWRLTKTPNQH